MRPRKLKAVIQKAINLDREAMEQLCELYAKPILIQTRLLVRKKDEAEDVAQRVIIEMIRGIANLRNPYAFRGWLQRIIVNACYGQDKQTRSDLEHGDLLEQAELIVDDRLEARPEDYAIAKDMREYLGGFLGQLPPSQAVTIAMYYYEQLSYKEIAAATGVSIGTVANTMSKAKTNLKKLLRDKKDSASLGIVFSLPFFKDTLGRTVVDEVNSGISDEAVTQLISAGKVAVAGTTFGTKVIIAADSTLKAGVAIAVAVAVLGGSGVAAYQIANIDKEEVEITRPDPIVLGPDSRVTYSVPVQQTVDDATNPGEIWLSLLTGEHIDRWVMTETASGRAILVGQNEYLNIDSLELATGDYTITWYVTNPQGIESRIYFDFFIRK